MRVGRALHLQPTRAVYPASVIRFERSDHLLHYSINGLADVRLEAAQHVTPYPGPGEFIKVGRQAVVQAVSQ